MCNVSNFLHGSVHGLVTIAQDRKEAYQQNLLEVKNEIKLLAETMKQGFKAVDRRFEDQYKYMDKRFEDMNKRFTMMFTFMNIGFGLLVLITILFKFLQ